ncbi:MAG: glycosyl hydrolase [Eubacteriales bacterium]
MNSTTDTANTGMTNGGEPSGTMPDSTLNDLYQAFLNPDESLRSKPLWFWNTSLDNMTTDTVREIVRESYLQSGYNGFGILPYWLDGYLSDRYFELYEAALDEGSKYGMEFSLYDENGFPSYTAGGLLAERYPDLTAKRLDMTEATAVIDGKIFLKIPQGTFMGAVAWNTETGEMLDISDYAVLVTVPEFDPDTQPGGAFASSTYDEVSGYEADKAFDGNPETRWNAYQHSGGGTYLAVGYDSPVVVDEVRIYEPSDSELQRIRKFIVQIYDGEKNVWTTVGSGTTVGKNGVTVKFDPVETRFVRAVFDQVEGDSATVSEMEVCLNGIPYEAPASSEGEKTEMGYFSSSDFAPEYGAQFAFDGKTDTRWNAKDGNKTDQWLSVLYGKEVTVDSVRINEAFGRVTSFAIQILDGGQWKDIVTGSSLGSNYSVEFSPVKTTGIRLLMKSVKSDTASIVEFSAYGNGELLVPSEDIENYKGSYLEYPVEGDNWKLMAFVTVKDAHKGMDYLSEESVAAFIEITYEEYYRRFKEYFDNGTITSAFYDEPCFWPSNANYGVQGARTWTEDFNEVFAQMYGDEINPILYYPALFYDIGEKTAEARDRLMAVRTEMFAKNYIGQIDDWCRSHGIKLMGHMNCEDVESPLAYEGDLMYCFKYQEIPSVDVIYNYGMTDQYYKVISSSAYNWDKALVGVECYGAMGTNLPEKDLYKCAMDLYAKGINVMVPHAVWYDNLNNVVFPPELSWRNPNYTDVLPVYNQYIARLSTLLQSGRHVADVAVLYPIDAMEAEYCFNGSYCIPEDSNYVEITDALSTKLRIDFTYLHPSVLNEKCSVQGNLLHLDNAVNYEDYRVLILPAMDTIDLDNLTQIFEFYQKGGTVISVGTLPMFATDAGENEAVREIVRQMFGQDADADSTVEATNDQGGQCFHIPDVSALEQVMKQAQLVYDVNIAPVTDRNGHLTYIHKVLNQTDVWFFANSSEKDVQTEVILRGEYAGLELWDPMTGERTLLDFTVKDGNTAFTLSLDKVSSVFVVECG